MKREELDSWNGFADGWRCYPMYELDDLFCDCKVSEFLEKIDMSCFDMSDDYFQDTIYGLRTVSDNYEAYADETDEEKILDNLIEEYSGIDLNWINSELDEIVKCLANEDSEELKELFTLIFKWIEKNAPEGNYNIDELSDRRTKGGYFQAVENDILLGRSLDSAMQSN